MNPSYLLRRQQLHSISSHIDAALTTIQTLLRRLDGLNHRSSLLPEQHYQFAAPFLEQAEPQRETVRIEVESKHNWVLKYLDSGVCLVKSGTEITVQTLEDRRLSILREGVPQQVSLEQFNADHPSLHIQFPRHILAHRLPLESVFQITVDHPLPLLISVPACGAAMQRILLIRINHPQSPNFVVWGNYSTHSFADLLQLTPGQYILLSLSSCPNTQVDLYLLQQHSIQLSSAAASSLKTLNLLISCSAELAEAKDPSKELTFQFLRVCYMDMGLILEVYNNVEESVVRFRDEHPQEEDKQLLFSELYTPRHIEDVYGRRETVVKYFQVTAKPARLFLPKKKMLIKGKETQPVSEHSIFR